MDKKFDREKLAEFNGQNGKATYVAKDGKVYDVSESKLWQNGEHMKRHHAGEDLSDVFSAAPHGPEVLERFHKIGTLIEPSTSAPVDPRLPSWLNKLLELFPLLARHPHPMLVHFPIAFMIAVPLFYLLTSLTGNSAFETTAFHCLGIGLLFTPLTIATGFYTWWLNYHSRLSLPIKIKIIGSTLLMLLMLVLFFWRYTVPDIYFAQTALRRVYQLLLLGLLPVVSVIGWYGACLTFPHGKKK